MVQFIQLIVAGGVNPAEGAKTVFTHDQQIIFQAIKELVAEGVTGFSLEKQVYFLAVPTHGGREDLLVPQ